MVFVAQNVAVGSEDAFKIISLRQVERESCSLQGERSESVKVLDSHCIWEKKSTLLPRGPRAPSWTEKVLKVGLGSHLSLPCAPPPASPRASQQLTLTPPGSFHLGQLLAYLQFRSLINVISFQSPALIILSHYPFSFLFFTYIR